MKRRGDKLEKAHKPSVYKGSLNCGDKPDNFGDKFYTLLTLTNRGSGTNKVICPLYRLLLSR